MPTTLIGLVVFIVLLMPGFAFTLRRERHTKAERRLSPFRETIAIAFSSVVADSIAVAVFYLIRRSFPQITPDVDALMNTSTEYFKKNYWDILGWAAILLTVATAGAFSAASPSLTDRFLSPFLSAWGVMFGKHADKSIKVYVGCNMADGSYVAGYLHSHSRLSDDSPDRDLSLTGDIVYRAPENEDFVTLTNVGGVVLSARNILMLTISYVEQGEDLPVDEDLDTE
jgi:uncharacterized protein DUF6338